MNTIDIYDKYQILAKSKGLQTNYISYWARKLCTTKNIIAKEVSSNDFDHAFKDPYDYKSHSKKKKIAISNQPLFLKFKFRL